MRLDLEMPSASTNVAEPAEEPATINFTEAREMLAEGIKAAQAGSRRKARAALLRAVDLHPRSESGWLWLASISEYPEELLVFLNNVLEINPENQRAVEWVSATKSLLSKTFVQRGINAVEEKRSDYAAQFFSQALEYDQNNSMAWLWMASLDDSSEGKIAYFEKVLAIEPENETALGGFSAARYEISQRQLAEARLAAVGGRSADANEFLDAIIAENPDSEDAWILRAHLAEGFEAKISAYGKVLELNPANAAARGGIDSLRSIMEMVAPATPAVAGTELVKAETVESVDVFPEVGKDKSPPQDLEFPAGFEMPAETPSMEPVLEFSEDERVVFDKDEHVDTFASFADDSHTRAEEEQVEGADSEEIVFEPLHEAEVEEAEEAVHYDSVSEGSMSDNAAFLEETSQEPHSDAVSDDFAAILMEQRIQSEREYANSIHVSIPQPPQSFSDGDEFVHVTEASSYETYVPERAEAEPIADQETIEVTESYDAPALEYADTSSLGVSVVSVAGAGNTFTHVAFCPFCNGENDVQAVSCQTCLAVLTLSDLEMLINNNSADKLMLRDAVERMERERLSQEFSENELTMLGIGHLNLRNLQYGFNYLQQAAQLSPNNVVLGGQVNALHIRLDEIKRREEIQDALPKGKTILVVDDSPTVRKLIAGKLEKSGHQVYCSSDGVEALERLEEMVPDLVLLDITMPRLDGYQVCKSIRSNPATKDVPVVMISGKDGFFDKVRGRMAGTTGYITKPFGPETLMKAVEAYLGWDDDEMIN